MITAGELAECRELVRRALARGEITVAPRQRATEADVLRTVQGLPEKFRSADVYKAMEQRCDRSWVSGVLARWGRAGVLRPAGIKPLPGTQRGKVRYWRLAQREGGE